MAKTGTTAKLATESSLQTKIGAGLTTGHRRLIPTGIGLVLKADILVV